MEKSVGILVESGVPDPMAIIEIAATRATTTTEQLNQQ